MVLSILVAGALAATPHSQTIDLCDQVLRDAEKYLANELDPRMAADLQITLAHLWGNRDRQRSAELLWKAESTLSTNPVRSAMPRLVRAWAQIEPQRAVRIVDNLDAESRQDEEGELVRSLAEQDPQAAAHRFMKFEGHYSYRVIDDVIDADTSRLCSRALRFATSLEGNERRYAIGTVAAKLAPKHFEEALKLSNFLETAASKASFYDSLFFSIVDKIPANAITLLDRVDGDKVYAKARLAVSVASSNPALSRQLAREALHAVLNGPKRRLHSRIDAVAPLGRIDPEGLRQVLEMAGEPIRGQWHAMPLVEAWVQLDIDKAENILATFRSEAILVGCVGANMTSEYVTLLAELIRTDPDRAAKLVRAGKHETFATPGQFIGRLASDKLPNLERFYELLGKTSLLRDFERLNLVRNVDENPGNALPFLQRMRAEDHPDLVETAQKAALASRGHLPTAISYLEVLEERSDFALGYAKLARSVYATNPEQGSRLFLTARQGLTGRYENSRRLVQLGEQIVGALGSDWK